MRKLRILLDMDGIVVNLLDDWLYHYNREYDDNVTREDITSWDVHKYVKPECGKNIYRILARPGLFDHLPAIDGAIDAVTELADMGHDIRFATAPPSPDSCRGKVEWIRRNFSHLDYGMSRVFFLHDKHWLAPSVDVLVDDKPQTILEWSEYANNGEPSPRILTIVHPYNREEAEQAHFAALDYQNGDAAWASIVAYVKEMAETR